MMIVTSQSPSADQEKFLKSLKRSRTRNDILIHRVERSIEAKQAEEQDEREADAIRMHGLGVRFTSLHKD